MWTSVLWGLALLTCALTSGLIAHQIADDTESEMPISERPSWKSLRMKRAPFREVRLHSRMFPQRRGIRIWWLVSYSLTVILFLSGLFATIVRVGQHP